MIRLKCYSFTAGAVGVPGDVIDADEAAANYLLEDGSAVAVAAFEPYATATATDPDPPAEEPAEPEPAPAEDEPQPAAEPAGEAASGFVRVNPRRARK